MVEGDQEMTEAQIKAKASQIFVDIFEHRYLITQGNPICFDSVKDALCKYFQVDQLPEKQEELIESWLYDAEDGDVSFD